MLFLDGSLDCFSPGRSTARLILRVEGSLACSRRPDPAAATMGEEATSGGTTAAGAAANGLDRIDDSNKEAAQAAQALERVTDHVEEKQLDEGKVHKVSAANRLIIARRHATTQL